MGRAATWMASSRALRSRAALWLGFVAVLLPLALLLGVQYMWLVDLEKTSSIARRVTLMKFLDAVDKGVWYFYSTQAERALNLPPSVFEKESLEKIPYFFKKAKVEGARSLFVVSFLTKKELTLVWDPHTDSLRVPKYSAETLALWTATAPWSVLANKGGKVKETELTVDERSREHRIIFKPITNEKLRLVGLAGMIVDSEFFGKELLPKEVRGSVPCDSKSELVMAAWDGHTTRVLCGGYAKLDPKHTVTRHLSFVFTDWKLSLADKNITPEKWARRNFTYNMTISAVLAVILLAGVVLALRTASREMKLSIMKNDFVSNVSHELRTPLASIRVFGEFLRLGRVRDASKVQEYGEYIETESRRLTQLVNNILDFSRIESGRKVYTFEDADVEEVVRGAVATFAVRVRNSGFSIKMVEPGTELPLVAIDPGALDQAVCNLLDNAVKYSGDSREVVVSLSTTDGHIIISVTDHGIGISREEQRRIFDRFHRVGTGLVHEVRGSGLGLAIVRHIVQAHGGAVTVESEPGRGSTFSLWLPINGPGVEEGGVPESAGKA